MRIAVGSDHAGFDLKEVLRPSWPSGATRSIDLGTASGEVSVDYPDFGAAVGRAVASGRAELGVCVCGTGIGIGMAANKIPGVRAAVVHDVTTATLARRAQPRQRHLPGRPHCSAGPWPSTRWTPSSPPPSEHGRHDVRIAKLADLDRGLEPGLDHGLDPLSTSKGSRSS